MNLEHYLYLFVKNTSPKFANSIEFLQVAMNFLCHKLQTSTSIPYVQVAYNTKETDNNDKPKPHVSACLLCLMPNCCYNRRSQTHRRTLCYKTLLFQAIVIEGCVIPITFRNVIYSSYFCRFHLQSKDYGMDVPFILFHSWWMLTCSWFNQVGPHFFFFFFLFISFLLAFCGVLS